MDQKQYLKKISYALSLLMIFQAKALVDVDSGNWYEKLHWWKKAKPQYETIESLSSKIKGVQKELAEKRNSFLPKYEGVFTKFHIKQSGIVAKLNDLIDLYKMLLDELLEEDEEVQKERASLYNEIKTDLEYLKLDFEMFGVLKSRLDQAVLQVLVDQLKQVDAYEDKALDSFDEIEKIFDDKKARELYEVIENVSENVKASYQFVNGSLRQFINEAIGKSNQLITNIEQKVKDLKDKKVYLSSEDEEEAKKIEEEEKAAEILAKKKEKKVVKQPIKKESSSFSWLWDLFEGLFFMLEAIWYYIKYPFSFLLNKLR